MKLLRQKCIGFAAGVLVIVQLAGCISSEQFYRQASLSREHA